MKKKCRIFPVVILLLILTAGCGFPSRAAAPRTIYFFYNNPCASCHEEEKIYEIFQETFSDVERKKRNYDLWTAFFRRSVWRERTSHSQS